MACSDGQQKLNVMNRKWVPVLSGVHKTDPCCKQGNDHKERRAPHSDKLSYSVSSLEPFVSLSLQQTQAI